MSSFQAVSALGSTWYILHKFNYYHPRTQTLFPNPSHFSRSTVSPTPSKKQHLRLPLVDSLSILRRTNRVSTNQPRCGGWSPEEALTAPTPWGPCLRLVSTHVASGQDFAQRIKLGRFCF